MAKRNLVKCSSCNFTNRASDETCVICKAPLPEPADELTTVIPSVKSTKDFDETADHGTAPGASPATPRVRVDTAEGEAADEKVLAWLCCDPLPAIPVGSRRLLTVGRSDKCDLVLPHKVRVTG